MNEFIHPDFLLQNDTARELYHHEAAALPIIDYHCHLDPAQIAEDHRFRSLTELWLGGDHYKWRALRANGIDERYITGDADDWEKFEKWAETIPYTLRNPLYHWTHLELKTAFGITETLNPASARRIYDHCNELLTLPEYSAQGFMKRYGVECVCTTDDPADDLHHHDAIKASGFACKVLPAWRPDKAVNVTTPEEYRRYLDRLSEAASLPVRTFDELLEALQRRHAFFHNHGCRLADHGVGAFPSAEYTEAEIRALYNKVYDGHTLTPEEKQKYQSGLLFHLAEMNADAGWTQQFHYGALRNTNTRMFRRLGADAGFDTIGDYRCAEALARFFDRLDEAGKLAKTIVYNLNPTDNEMLAAMVANFQDGSVAGKMQLGAAWWFNDQLEGMTRQLNALSEQGLLSRFVGMLTDSRSFVSYPRHEYFRRLLCNLLGADVEAGLLPRAEMERIRGMVRDICYYNAKHYLALY